MGTSRASFYRHAKAWQTRLPVFSAAICSHKEGVRRPCVACLLGQALGCASPRLAELGSPAGKREATTTPHSHDLVSLLDISSHDHYFSPEVRSHLSVTKGQHVSLCSHSKMAWLELSRANRFFLFCQSTTGIFRYARRSRGRVL